MADVAVDDAVDALTDRQDAEVPSGPTSHETGPPAAGPAPCCNERVAKDTSVEPSVAVATVAAVGPSAIAEGPSDPPVASVIEGKEEIRSSRVVPAIRLRAWALERLMGPPIPAGPSDLRSPQRACETWSTSREASEYTYIFLPIAFPAPPEASLDLLNVHGRRSGPVGKEEGTNRLAPTRPGPPGGRRARGGGPSGARPIRTRSSWSTRSTRRPGCRSR